MEWHFASGDYVVSGEGLRKLVLSSGGAVGMRGRPSDGPLEFPVVIKRQNGYVNVGVADATDEDTLKGGSKAFGVLVGEHFGGVGSICTNALRKDCCQSGQLRSHDLGKVSEIRMYIQDRRLRMSFNGEDPIDCGFDLPSMVAPWFCSFEERSEIEFVEVQNVVLQLFAHTDDDCVAVECINMNGITLQRLHGLSPHETGEGLMQRIREHVPAPLDSQWKMILPSRQILDREHLGFSLSDLFELTPEAEEHRAVEGCAETAALFIQTATQ